MTNENGELRIPIENDVTLRDVFCELAGVTEYHVEDVQYVNFAFLGHKVTSFSDQSGHPVESRINLRKVASITMTRDKAIEFRNMLSGMFPELP